MPRFFSSAIEEVEAVELLRVEGAAVGLRGVDDAARRGEIDEVQPHHVDAETREGGRVHGSVFV